MCKNIHTLHNYEPPATEEEVRGAALQYVRKISGMHKPSRANEAAFERAVDEVAAASGRLLDELVTTAPPRDREIEAAKARGRARERFGAVSALEIPPRARLTRVGLTDDFRRPRGLQGVRPSTGRTRSEEAPWPT
jgi:hypothetical protein